MLYLLARFPGVALIILMVIGSNMSSALGQDADVTNKRSKLEKYSYRQPCMGTVFGFTLYAKDQITANRAAKAAFDRIRELDTSLSDYKSDSELNRLCRTAGKGAPVSVSDDLWNVLKFSKTLSIETNGAFDVTIGPLVKLWREARRTGIFPDNSTLAKRRSTVGYKLLSLSEAPQRVTLTDLDMQLDLGGVAKGYALDAALTTIREKFDITQALIDGGGDVLVGDAPPGRESWNVAVRNPKNESKPWIVPLVNASLATSGDLHQFVEFGNRRFSHIVDPQTGMGLTHRMQVSIVAPTGMEADALASAVSVMGATKGMEFVRARAHCEALLVFSGEDGTETESSDGFPVTISGSKSPL